MVNPSKRKGTRWESDLLRYLKERGLAAYSPRQLGGGTEDVGDIHGLAPFVGQAKAYADLATGLRLGIAGAERQKTASGERWGVLFLKAPRRSVGDGYAVQKVETFAEVLEALREGEEARWRLEGLER